MRGWSVALAGLVVLVGCSDLSETSGAQRTKQAAPASDATKQGVELKTLGVVNVEVTQVSFQVADNKTYEWAGLLGHWVEAGAVIPAAATHIRYFKPAPDGINGHFVSLPDASGATRVFYETPTYDSSALSFSRGSSQPRRVSVVDGETVGTQSGYLGTGVLFAAEFPTDSTGNIVVSARPGYVLGLRPVGGNSSVSGGVGGSIAYSVQTTEPSPTPVPSPTPFPVFEAAPSQTNANPNLTSPATASVRIQVKEIDGKPVAGLSRENFQIGSDSLQSLGGAMGDLGEGAYQLTLPVTKYDVERDISFEVHVVNKPGLVTGRLYRPNLKHR